MDMKEPTWKTSITKVEPNKLLLRGYRLDELMGAVTFSQGIFLAIRGNLPTEKESKILDAILVSSIDHGVTPPSCLAARTIASTGAPLSAALAGAILAISKHHGGAIEDTMGLFQEAVSRTKALKETNEEAALAMIREYREARKRLPGYGHRLHTEDPRSKRLFQMAYELEIAGEHVKMAESIEAGIGKTLGKHLPLNVDGAIAALLCEMGFPSELGNAFFMMARVAGVIAHVFEEQTTMRPMRHINPKEHVYDGVPERTLS
jgi:citrate synthase